MGLRLLNEMPNLALVQWVTDAAETVSLHVWQELLLQVKDYYLGKLGTPLVWFHMFGRPPIIVAKTRSLLQENFEQNIFFVHTQHFATFCCKCVKDLWSVAKVVQTLVF
jgi:hypothetical protein